MTAPSYHIFVSAALFNKIFCDPETIAQIMSGSITAAAPKLQEWMRDAIRHTDDTKLSDEEFTAVMETMPVDAYLAYIEQIINICTPNSDEQPEE